MRALWMVRVGGAAAVVSIWDDVRVSQMINRRRSIKDQPLIYKYT